MNKLPLIIALLFTYNATASSLPNCPSDPSLRWDNCVGTYIWPDGEKYVGEFKDGKRHGRGTNTFADGEKYVGEYKDGKRQGQGTYTYASGAKYVGEYKDGKMHGQGTYTYASGEEERGYHMNDEYVPTICENMGLRKGSESYGNCVLELIKEINSDN